MLPTNRWNHADFGICPFSNHIQHLLSTCHSSLLSNNHLTLYSIHLSTSSHVGTNSYCTLSTSSRLHILQGLTDHPCLPLTQLCSHSPYSSSHSLFLCPLFSLPLALTSLLRRLQPRASTLARILGHLAMLFAFCLKANHYLPPPSPHIPSSTPPFNSSSLSPDSFSSPFPPDRNVPLATLLNHFRP